VLAEKPSCVQLRQFEPLAAKAKAKNLHLILALANRLDPVVMEAHRLIRAGTIGRIYGTQLHIVADQTRLTKPAYHQTWTAKKSRAGGGHLIWLGIHWLDLAMYLTGSRITAVTGFTGNVGGQPIDTEDSAAVTMRFDNGTFGSISSGYYLDQGYHSMLKFWGSDGWLEIRKHDVRPGSAPLEWHSNREVPAKTRRYEGPLEPTGYTPFVQHVVRVCSAGGGQPVLSTADGLHVLKTVFAAYRAAETGSAQQI
jgi:predicted dehydrogenase